MGEAGILSACRGIVEGKAEGFFFLNVSIAQHFIYLFLNLFIYLLFIFGRVGTPNVARGLVARGLSLVVASGGCSSLRCTGSRSAGFSSCGTWAQ